MRIPGSIHRLDRAAFVLLLVSAAFAVAATTAGRRFYDDDPIAREPESQDASGAAAWDIGLMYDLTYNLFVSTRRPVENIRARNVNTIDEVPDSSWFTNRIGARAVPIDEAVRGPNVGPAPTPGRWTLIREKTSGFAPGFTARDPKGETWFVSFDPPSNPDGATGSIVVATKIFWALGYNQVENFITSIHLDDLDIDPKATYRQPSGERTPLKKGELEAVMRRAHRGPDGSYRATAGRAIGGKILGGFRYHDTRPDDPNDVVPHQHRRELRALRVFGAWTNLSDMKAGNTLDTLVTENGRQVVKHYLQDVGSTFGIGANGPHEWDEGWEYLYQGNTTLKRLGTLGFWFSPWQTADYEDYDAIGRFEGDSFDPETWRPRVPTMAYLHMRDDDAFWAARRVMAFSDDLIRAIVKTGQYSDPAAEQYLADVLIKRRDKIGRAYLPKINPIVDPVLSAAGVLTFGNAAVKYKFASMPESYKAVWYSFDNTTGESSRITETRSKGEQMAAPTTLPTTPGSFVRVELSASSAEHPSWARPIQVYFTHRGGQWTLVGLERVPDGQ